MAKGDIVDYLEHNNGFVQVEGDDGAVYTASLVASPSLPVVSKSFELAIQEGRIPGYSMIQKFGENPDVDTGTVPEDVWEYGGIYPFDSFGTAPIVSIVSDNPLDTQIIKLSGGLDVAGNSVEQDIQLNGTSRVALNTPLWRFNRAENEGVEGDDLNGTIYIYTGLGDVPLPSEIRGILVDGNNQTLMALYTIPKGKVGFFYRGEIGGSRSVASGQIQGSLSTRRVGRVFKINKRVDVSNSGSSIYQDKRTFPDVLPALTDVRTRIEGVSANKTGVFAAFDMLLVDEGLFPVEYLETIGQPGY